MTDGPVDAPRYDLLTHRARATPEKTAVIDADAGEAWTYREFHRQADHAALGFDPFSHGRVAFLLDGGRAFATAFFGAMRRGATVAPLNVRETDAELDRKLDRLDVDALVCGPETEDRAVDLVDAPVRSVGEPTTDAAEPLFEPVSEFTIFPKRIRRGTTQLVMFTSGTAGEPKGVRLTVDNLVASATASAFRLGVLPDDRWLCCLPMYHMGGLAPVIRSTLYGTAVVIQREFDPAETARVVDEHDVTGVSLVPTMLGRLLDEGWRPPASLRFVLLGGAPASDELLDRCEAAGVPVYPTYGMTETASQVATATPEEALAHRGTVGHPLQFTEVSVVDGTGEPVGPGERGELVVSGPTVTPGYLDDEHTEAAFGERGLHTGDVGYRDEVGRLWVVGRRADRIVTGGENVDPDEVVDVLATHPGVEGAAVVGLADEEWGERVAALVVPATERRPSLESLLAHCDERLAGFKRPKTVGFADALPRTPSGTVDREAVRERLREDGTDVASGR
ncbi:class I adenylate-forming enzyme family protein [Salinilacihabitans rarus]|uniref:class I adenylate-forming enzyme family protein n=1 Tax=Salinilacihabitans rarus TaxID=2961596 RepID=UPI0020C92D4C|nr:AMP-binding protein [Salinilacihabitans rarus]